MILRARPAAAASRPAPRGPRRTAPALLATLLLATLLAPLLALAGVPSGATAAAATAASATDAPAPTPAPAQATGAPSGAPSPAALRAQDAGPAVRAATPERPLVVAGVAGLEWSDVDRSRTPHLWNLVAGGDAASISVRTLSPTCPVDAWLTLSAGNRVTSGGTTPAPDVLTEGEEPPSAPVLRCRPEPSVSAVDPATADPTDSTGPARVLGWDELVAPQPDATGSYGHPGTLGDALAEVGVCATAVGRGAAVALARSDGSVDRYAPTVLPLRSSPGDAARDLGERLTACPVTVVDLGTLPDPAAERAEALAELDAAVGHLYRALPDGGRLIVSGVADTPLGPRGPGQVAVDRTRGSEAGPTWLSSAATRREGVVGTNDLSATLAAAVGVDITSFDGKPLERGEPRRLDTAGTIENRRYLETLTETVPPVTYALLGTLGAATLLCLPLVLRGRTASGRRLGTAVLTVAAMLPAAAPLATISRWWSSPAPGAVLALATVVPAVVLAIAAWALDRPLGRLLPPGRRATDTVAGDEGGSTTAATPTVWRLPLAVSALTWVVLTADGLTGTTLQEGSPLGPSLALGARFYGFGNTVFAVYAVASLVLAAALAAALQAAGRRRAAVAAVAVVGVVTVLVDGLPALGADAGGIVTLVPAFVVLLLAVAGRRPSARHVLVAAASTVAVVVAVALSAWLLPGPGGHLGRFVQRMADGDAVSLVVAKAAGAWATVANPGGALGTVLVLVVAWAVLAPGRRPWGRLAWLARAYREHALLRTTVVSLVVVAGVGSVLNDSGVVVALVVLVLGAAVLGTGAGTWTVPRRRPGAPADAAAPAVRRTPTTIAAVGGGMLLVFLLATGIVPPSSGTGTAGGQTTALGSATADAAVGSQDQPLVVVGTTGMRWTHVRPATSTAPHLSRLLADGADAAGVSMTTGAAARCEQGGWLALSAGQLAEVARERNATGAWDCPELDVVTAGERDGTAAVAGWDELAALQRGSTYEARLGRLGTALATAGTCTTAVGPGAAVALAGTDGQVTRYRTLEQAVAPGSDAFRCPVTVVDAGSTRDAETTAEGVAAVDATVGRVLDAVPSDATVLVVDVANLPGSRAALGVALVRPPADQEDRPRFLSSAATRTEGVVRLQDVPATLLDAAGVAVPTTLEDTPLVRAAVRPAGSAATADELADLTTRDHVRRSVYTWLVDVPLYAGLGLAALCLVAARLPRVRTRVGPRAWRAAETAALLLSALPAGAFLGSLGGWWRFEGATVALWVATGITTLIVAGLAALAPRRPTWAAAGVVAGITFGALTLDALAGTPLNRASPLGSAPTFGARFYGFGNPTFSVYAVAGLIFAAAVAQLLVQRGRRVLAAVAVGVIGVVALVIDVWPTLGADLGGGLVLVPAFVVVGLVASGARVTLQRFVLVAAAGVAAVAAVGVLDWLRPPAERSHLGRFVEQVVDGEAWGILARKAGYALRSVLGGVPVWVTLLVLVLAAVPLIGPASVRARFTPSWFVRAEERWPLLRPAVLAIWAMAVLGSLVNDFGVRIAMIALIPAVPLLTLVALQSADRPAPPARRG
ncbi:hypothetical protein [Xylanimonas oleitrophica]|uniref:hypothetical protein n=1 Tax=Xylanimonas oleitrophica TaxID=2607479 RepID=UPI0011B7E87B|nr:hypothetical protein [Xylanimonas oleitrophica]